MTKKKIDFSERDALKNFSLSQTEKVPSFESILKGIKIIDFAGSVKDEDREFLSLNTDISLWLNNIGEASKFRYLTDLSYFLKCVNLNPSALLDLKIADDLLHRHFPAFQLVQTWMMLAKKHGLSSSRIHNVLMVVRSFFKHNLIPLQKIIHVYRPKPKPSLDEKQLRRFRESFDFYGKVLFDFFLSVPVRDGQFQHCKTCGYDFFPRWSHIATFPRIAPFSPFIIWPQKGHESEKYKFGLRQVCFLTETIATELNALRDVKETMLGRRVKPEEFIFTHHIKQKYGIIHVTPIVKETIIGTFRSAERVSGVHVTPQLLRSWTNSVLAVHGIEKQLRDLYLGHACAYEMGYIIQLIPQWQQLYRKTKALEDLEAIASGAVATSTLSYRKNLSSTPNRKLSSNEDPIDKLHLSNQELELLQKLRKLSNEDFGLLGNLLKRIQSGESGLL